MKYSSLQKPYILKVAIPVPLRQLFDYLPPIDNSDFLPLPGTRVLVPFGFQKKIGIIVKIVQESEYPIEKLKPIYEILDPKPLFPNTLLELIEWAARYYQSPLGEVFEAALPGYLRKIQSPLVRNKKHIKIKNSTTELSKPKFINVTLNPGQKKAIEAIQQSFGKYKTFLLDGVTGSGKTEIYIQVVEKVLSFGRQALILIPEIGLTPQLLARFEERFSVPIVALNSSITEKKRFEAWENARTGKAPIVIGTRLSVFTPLKSSGIFIIDEEHDPSFKQQDGFRYHARDLLIMRGSLEQCPVVLGSATPSLETLHNTHIGRFQNLKLPNRAGNATFPTIQILDIRHKKLEAGLSAQLMKKMREHLDKQGQILLFLNRRGYAPILMCFGCGFIAACNHCDAKMTLHYQSQQLQCHHCEKTAPLYAECPTCHNKDLKPIGVGTERLEAVLQKYFPKHSIIRIDRDTTRKKRSDERNNRSRP